MYPNGYHARISCCSLKHPRSLDLLLHHSRVSCLSKHDSYNCLHCVSKLMPTLAVSCHLRRLPSEPSPERSTATPPRSFPTLSPSHFIFLDLSIRPQLRSPHVFALPIASLRHLLRYSRTQSSRRLQHEHVDPAHTPSPTDRSKPQRRSKWRTSIISAMVCPISRHASLSRRQRVRRLCQSLHEP